MHERPDTETAAFGSLLRRLVLVREGEAKPLLWATAYFFLVMASYYLLRPMREAFGIAKGADKLPWLMTGTMLAMFLANPAFAALVSRLPRRRFIPASYRFFAANMAVFYALFRLLPGHGGTALGYAFYIWLSVFNLFVVSVFWALMADLFQEEQGRRLFGFIAVGGTLGALCGAGLTDLLTRGLGPLRLEPASLLLLSIPALEGSLIAVKRLADHFGLGNAAGGAREPGPGLFEGLRIIAKSPYLAMICAYMLLFTITSTFLYLEQGRIVAKAFASTAARTAAFARIDVWVNALTLAAQLFLTGRIIRAFGLRAALCILPVLTFAGFGTLWLAPAFGTLVLFQVLRRGLHYAVDRPVREILYIPLGAGEKYKSKPFIDTFVYRGGDLLGVWAPTALAALAVPLGAAALGLSGLWVFAGARLGTLRRRMGGD